MSVSFGDDNDSSNIPMADSDPQAVLPASPAPETVEDDGGEDSLSVSAEPDSGESGDSEREERTRLISQVLELQNTLDDLSQRVDGVKEENLKLRSENQVLAQYIENLMQASSVFQATAMPNNSTRK